MQRTPYKIPMNMPPLGYGFRHRGLANLANLASVRLDPGAHRADCWWSRAFSCRLACPCSFYDRKIIPSCA